MKKTTSKNIALVTLIKWLLVLQKGSLTHFKPFNPYKLHETRIF